MNEHEPTEEEWAIFRDPMLTHSEALTAMNAIRDKRIRAEAAGVIDALVQALEPFVDSKVLFAAMTRTEYAYVQNARAALAKAKAKGGDNG